jgi:hypothetical protein
MASMNPLTRIYFEQNVFFIGLSESPAGDVLRALCLLFASVIRLLAD